MVSIGMDLSFSTSLGLWIGWGPGTPAACPYPKSWQVPFLWPKDASNILNTGSTSHYMVHKGTIGTNGINWKVSEFFKIAKRKQGVFEKSTAQTPLYLRCRYCWITLVYFATNVLLKIHLFTTNIESLLTISSFLSCICRHPVLHRADTPHVWLYTVWTGDV